MSFEKQTISTTKSPLRLQDFPCSFGNYELLKPIAQGGMGAVYQVRSAGNTQEFALKILTDWREKTALLRFKNEISLISKLKHPGIVNIHDFGEDEQGIPFLVMDLIEGASLSVLLKKEGPFPLKRCLKILMQVCMALDYAHRHGVIHRDIKPANILVTPQGNPRIVDFGLAKNIQLDEESQKLTQTGQILGTPAYMAPEVISGEKEKMGPTTDIYSLGVTLYELLTGKLPYVGENSLNLFQQILTQPPIPPRLYNPSLPPQIEAIILKCLNKLPQERYKSVRDLGKDISRYLSDIPIQKQKKSSKIRDRFWALKRYWFLFFLLLLLGYGWKWHEYHAFVLEQTRQNHQQELQEKTQHIQHLYEFLKLEQQATALEALRSEKMKIDYQTQQEQFLTQQKILTETVSQLEEHLVFLNTQQEKNQEEQKTLEKKLQEATLWVWHIFQEIHRDSSELFLKKYGEFYPEMNVFFSVLKAEQQEDWNKAIQSLLEVEGSFQEIALGRAAELTLERKRDLKNTRVLLEKLETRFPKSPFLIPIKAGILFESREYEALAQILKEASTDFPFASLFYFQGVLESQLANYRASKPWRAPVHLKKGIRLLQKAVQLKPDESAYTSALGLAFYFQEDFLSAGGMFQETIKLRGNAIDWICLAGAFLNLRCPTEAKMALEKAITLDPENEIALYFQGRLKIQEERPEEALAPWESALIFWQRRNVQQNYLFPGHWALLESLEGPFQSTYSTLLLHLGEYRKASWLFDTMLKKNAETQRGALGIGKTFWFQNKPLLAQDYFRQAWVFSGEKLPETFLWNGFYALKQKDLTRAKNILESVPLTMLPLPVTLLFFRELLHLVPEDPTEELNRCSENERWWAKNLLLYVRGKSTLEQLWQSSSTPTQQARTYFYLGVLEKKFHQETRARILFEQCLQKKQILLEEHFMAWIELGGETYSFSK